jgi:hypothetical protein
MDHLFLDQAACVAMPARKMIAEEEQHLGEVDKMLRTPGDIASFAGRKEKAQRT